MRENCFFKRPIILLVVSAVLSALSFTFESLFFVSWLSFLPLFCVIANNKNVSFIRTALQGVAVGFVYHACVYYWFAWFYPLEYVDFTNKTSIIVVCLAVLGISAVHGVLWCIPFILSFFAKRITNSRAFCFATVIVGIMIAQKLTQLGELSFPWVRIALGQYKATALIQSASIFGIDGVDILILAFNALLAMGVLSLGKKRIFIFCVAVAIFCANLGFGLIQLNKNEETKPLNITTVQGSVDKQQKWSSDGDKICYDVYTNLTKEGITENTDLIIWPESAVPVVYTSLSKLKPYKQLSQELDVPVLTGVLLKNGSHNTNSAVLIDQNGNVTNYAKRQLVPFGEYMPYKAVLSRLFPYLDDLNIIEDDYVSGNSTAIMQVNGGKIGSIICFESIYPHLTRQSVLDGAQMLVELTNDSWLEDSPAIKQHLAHGVFRSIENGRYLVRSANSGISAVIDDKGRIKSQLDVNEQGVITDTVYLKDNQTLYTKTGDVIFPICCATVLIWFIVLLIKRKKSTDN